VDAEGVPEPSPHRGRRRPLWFLTVSAPSATSAAARGSALRDRGGRAEPLARRRQALNCSAGGRLVLVLEDVGFRGCRA
jgi:hypothetical protein